jgi:hypothetical protein
MLIFNFVTYMSTRYVTTATYETEYKVARKIKEDKMDRGRLREKRNAYKIFVGKSEGWRPVGIFKCRYDWIKVARDRE